MPCLPHFFLLYANNSDHLFFLVGTLFHFGSLYPLEFLKTLKNVLFTYFFLLYANISDHLFFSSGYIVPFWLLVPTRISENFEKCLVYLTFFSYIPTFPTLYFFLVGTWFRFGSLYLLEFLKTLKNALFTNIFSLIYQHF